MVVVLTTPVTLSDERALTERRLGALGRMAQIGLLVVRALQRCLPAAMAAGGLLRAINAFDRAARAIRLICVLRAKLVADLDRLEAGLPAPASSPRAAATRETDIDGEEDDREPSERAETREPGARFGSILRRPIEEIIARICKDLGVFPELRRLIEAAWDQPEVDVSRAAEALSETVAWPPPRVAAPKPAARRAASPLVPARSPA